MKAKLCRRKNRLASSSSNQESSSQSARSSDSSKDFASVVQPSQIGSIAELSVEAPSAISKFQARMVIVDGKAVIKAPTVTKEELQAAKDD